MNLGQLDTNLLGPVQSLFESQSRGRCELLDLPPQVTRCPLVLPKDIFSNATRLNDNNHITRI